MGHLAINKDEMTAWSGYVHQICGVFLDESKAYLVQTRLGNLLQETGSKSWMELLAKAKSPAASTLKNKIINLITTNETSFFRDTSPFEMLKFKILPELIDRRNKIGLKPVPIRILSAACSTGQEAYSAAIVLKELLGSFVGYDIRIVGLDISDAAIAAASYGHYSKMELDRGLGKDKFVNFFDPTGDKYKIKDELRSLAVFRKANLLEPINSMVSFDIIFCRNVAIYFTEPNKIKLFSNLKKVLARDGALIIGSTESITGLCPEFIPMRYLRAIYYNLKA